MTHSLHRRGTRKSLERDYVLFVCYDTIGTDIQRRASPETRKTYAPPTRKALQICAGHNPVCLATSDGATERKLRYMRGWTSGNTVDEILNAIEPCSCSAVYTSKKDMQGALRGLKEADLGLSVVVSGIFDDVFEGCSQIGVGPHTVNMSLGTFGKTERMAEAKILEIVTMCGHSYVSPSLVKHMIDGVTNGRLTPEQAAVELGRQCTCNFFNVDRAAQLIAEYLAS